jgi:hypothetical protein
VLKGNLAAVASLLAPVTAEIAQDFLVTVELVAEFIKSGFDRADRFRVRSVRGHLSGGEAQVESDNDPLNARGVVYDALEMDEFRPKHLHAALQLL